MALTYKVLGQSNPVPATTTTLYTVPSLTNCVISTISICNQGTTSTTFRLAVQPGGVALPVAAVSRYYVNYDTAVPGNDTIMLTLGLTMSASDILSVYSPSSFISFSAFGSEIV
jgi:hypothetical protein